MLHSILVALDDTPGAVAARDVAIALARHTGAALTAAVILDRPHTESENEPIPLGGRKAIEPIVEVFNLLNSKNLLVPQTTNLIFNFDGTIRAGLGDPFQVQVGARLVF